MSNLAILPKNKGLAKTKTKTKTKTNLPTLSTWFGNLFINDFYSFFSSNFNNVISLPKVNIKETTDTFLVEMAVPRMKKSDFDINLDNKIISISTELEENKEEKTGIYTHREFEYSSLKRAFALPDSVEEIRANYNDGILSIHLFKKEETKQKPSRSINIS